MAAERVNRTVRMSDAEWLRVQAAADGESPSVFVRRVVLEECGRLEAERARLAAERLERQRVRDAAHGYF